MGWATRHIAELQNGKTVKFRPHGNSMAGKVESGSLVTVEPMNGSTPLLHEVVLCKVRGAEYLHLVTALRGGQIQISNNKGHVNGWITAKSVYGRCVRIE